MPSLICILKPLLPSAGKISRYSTPGNLAMNAGTSLLVIVIQAVAKPSASIQLGARIVADKTSVCTG